MIVFIEGLVNLNINKKLSLLCSWFMLFGVNLYHISLIIWEYELVLYIQSKRIDVR